METALKTQRDLCNQNIYVGMDVHHKSWKVHIISDEAELKSFSMEPDVKRLSEYLKKTYHGANYYLAYEAGFCGYWIHRAFKTEGINCRIVHPADVPTNSKEYLRKSDAVDSRKIAKGLKNADLNFINIPDQELEADRSLIRSRFLIVRDLTRAKNRIKSVLKLNGINIPKEFPEGIWSIKFITWLKSLSFSSSSANFTFQAHLNNLKHIAKQKEAIDSSIKALSKSGRYSINCSLLQTIPSIGPLTSMIILTEIGDINRFKRLDELGSYCGIVPNCYSSGETVRVGSLTRRGNSMVKRVLIECSWVLMRKDPAMHLYYKKQAVRMKSQKAIIKVSRKLLNRIRYVLKNQKPYETGII